MSEQLSLPGLSVSFVTRGEMERDVLRAAEFCEAGCWSAWRKKYDDGLARRSLRWRRLKARRVAADWSQVAFDASRAFFRGR